MRLVFVNSVGTFQLRPSAISWNSNRPRTSRHKQRHTADFVRRRSTRARSMLGICNRRVGSAQTVVAGEIRPATAVVATPNNSGGIGSRWTMREHTARTGFATECGASPAPVSAVLESIVSGCTARGHILHAGARPICLAWPLCSFRSKGKPQSHLDLALRIEQGVVDPAEIGIKHVAHRIGKVRPVAQVEELRSVLQLQTLGQSEILEE